jgi:hypothetical protein
VPVCSWSVVVDQQQCAPGLLVLQHPVVLVLWYSVWSLLVFVVLVVIGGGGVPLVGRYVEARGKGREGKRREEKGKKKGKEGEAINQ